MAAANSGSVGRGKTFDGRSDTSRDVVRISGLQHRCSFKPALPESTVSHGKTSDTDNASLTPSVF